MKTQKSMELLDQILEKAQEDDRIHKSQKVGSKASETIGESWYVFHLKLLKKSMEEDAH